MKRRTALVDYAAYLAVRIVVCIIQALSWPIALGAARMLARAALRVDRRRREITKANLRHSFPHRSATAIARLAAANYEHLAILIVECIRMSRILRPDNVNDYINCSAPEERERIHSWLSSGRPIMAVTGHFGNWEVFSYSIGLLGYLATIVARRVDNPYLHQFLETIRCRTGQKFLDKNDDYDLILDVLTRRKILGMVGDQDAGPRGIFVDFLGRPASTYKSIALLSLEYTAPILVFGAARIGHPMQYRLYLEEVILPEDYAHDPDAPRTITARYTAALERLVHRHPEQYFWMHRRWKTEPRARRRTPAA